MSCLAQALIRCLLSRHTSRAAATTVPPPTPASSSSPPVLRVRRTCTAASASAAPLRELQRRCAHTAGPQQPRERASIGSETEGESKRGHRTSLLAELLRRHDFDTARAGDKGERDWEKDARRSGKHGREEGAAQPSRGSHSAAVGMPRPQGREGTEQAYVPLLFRRDFMQSWRQPRPPLPLEQLQSVSQTAPPSLAVADAPVHAAAEEEQAIPDPGESASATVLSRSRREAEGRADRGEESPLARAVTAAARLPEKEGEDTDAEAVFLHAPPDGPGDTEEPCRVVEDDADGYATYTVTALPTTSRVILDPVQWLSQSPDAPLMELETLFARISPAARELTFTSAVDPQPPQSVSAEAEGDVAFRGGDNTDAQPDRRAAEQPCASPADIDASDAGVTASTLTIREGREEAQPDAHLRHPVARSEPVPDAGAATAPHGGDAEGCEDDNMYKAGGEEKPFALNFSPKADPDAAARLVYNVFTRRVVKENSAVVQSLALLGIHVDTATRELTLQDEDALHSFTKKLREGAVTWPSFWSHSVLYRQLERFLADEHVTDPATRVKKLLAAQYRRLHGRHRVGVVAGVQDTEHGEKPESQQHLQSLIQSTDDKLFSLADLNEEQTRVVELVMRGYNVYIGGSAGTGKSVLLRVIRQQLRAERLTVAATGTTGVAATLIGGCTLHHCFGINMHGEFTRPKELAAYDVLIIDEVSMLPRDLFEKLEQQMRRANGVDLPFGGVQVILCGDFLQLGAIASQPVVNAPVFRRNFAMLKLQTAVRQAANPLFAQHLAHLRRGCVPAGLQESLNFITAPDALVRRHAGSDATKRASAEEGEQEALRQRQAAQLHSALGGEALAKLQTSPVDHAGTESPLAAPTDAAAPTRTTTTTTTRYVEGAVNLLPTNHEVHEANERELAKLPGDATVFMPQILPPNVNGLWSPTYLLRLLSPRLLDSRKLSLELELFMGEYFRKTEAGQAWLLGSMHQKHVVMYPLFVDALALRVRLPPDFTEEQIRRFTTFMDKELDTFLEKLNLGVRVREVLASAEGLQTEQDEYILDQYAQFAPMARPVALKLGARVMLRANLAPGLVNGSLGTVVGFRALSLEDIPARLRASPQRAEAVASYRDFLTYEQGFDTPIVPEVDFGGGRVEPIPPTIFYVGGLPNTHHYSLGIVALPLSLAYAFTVHKVQGLTLVGRVHLELSRMWPCEHLLYVAMSRVRNPEQLSISNFHDGLVKAAADCLVFDDALPSVEAVRLLPHFVPATWRRDPQRRKHHMRRKELLKLAEKKKKTRKATDDGPAAQRRRLAAEIQALQEKLLASAAARGPNPHRQP